jgi:hypothetical protein
MEDKLSKNEIAKDLVSKISPETVNNVIQTVMNVVGHSVEIIKDNKEFERKMREIKENNKREIDIINGWIKLIIEADLEQKQKEQLITDIRKIALG